MIHIAESSQVPSSLQDRIIIRPISSHIRGYRSSLRLPLSFSTAPKDQKKLCYESWEQRFVVVDRSLIPANMSTGLSTVVPNGILLNGVGSK